MAMSFQDWQRNNTGSGWGLNKTPEGHYYKDRPDKMAEGYQRYQQGLPTDSAQNTGSANQPARPGFASILNDGTGQLEAKYRLDIGDNDLLTPYAEQQLSGINLNTEALQELRKRGLATGPSAWANLATEAQGLEEARAKDSARTAGNQAASSAWNRLAMRGGLSGAARERIASQSALSTAKNLADVGAQGQQARYGIGLQDEQTRLGILQNLPGMEVQALQPQFQKAEMIGKAKDADIARNIAARQFNLGNTIQDVRGRNAFEMDAYSEAMKSWAAEKQAQAQEKSGK